MTENEIEDAVWKNVAKLGYSSAFAIRNARIGPEQGQVDLALFPRIGKKKVILVEAKRSIAEEAKCKVVGQIIMYLTGALQLSEEGIQLCRTYARKHPEKALHTAKTSPMQITGASSIEEAWQVLCNGTPIRLDQVALYIATDDEPRQQVERAVKFLAEHHGLHIGLIQASKSGIRVIK
jgi:hypothetical protein